MFSGNSNRRFRAYDAETGEILWQTILNAPVTGFPVSFEVGGEQYVTVAAGGGDLVSATYNRIAGLRVRTGSNTLYTFRLSATASEPGAATAAARAPDVPRTPAPDVRPIAEDSLAADRDPLPSTAPCVSFTAAQAQRGRAIYNERCAECHGPTLRGGTHGSPLAGRFFRLRWDDRRASALHATVRATMPPGGEGSLGARRTSRLLAYIFQTAGIETSNEAVDSDVEALRELRICVVE